ncbi:MAG: PD40 domain-containing protein [Myxococcales bacterium]|nr:PD40 domain-containing protein [Myxococcales bacterium]
MRKLLRFPRPSSSQFVPIPWTRISRHLATSLMLLWACLSFSSSSQALIRDGKLQWKVLTTPHFRIYFHQKLYRFALRSARIAEEAHKTLVPYARHAPSTKTHVFVLNNTYSANGAASVLPRNVIYLYTAPPHARSQLNDSDDWLRVLIYHEYLHILHLDTMSGVWPILNTILGKSFAPNFLLPLWWIEGWAVFAESAFTSGGRNYSSFFEMFFRASLLEQKQLRLDQVTHITSDWPRGIAPYLYGSRFLHYIARTYGKDKLMQFSHAYGATLIPFAINFTLHPILKKTYSTLWKEWITHEKAQLHRLLQRLKQSPPTPAIPLTRKGEWIERPRFLADGKTVLFYRSDGRKDQRLVKLDIQTRQQQDLQRLTDRATIGIDRTGKIALLSQPESKKSVYFYYDLFRLSPKDGGLQRLTWGERAHDIDLDPSGTWGVYVKREVAQTSLWRYDLATQKRTLLYRPPRHTVLSSPRIDPRGRYIVMSAWSLGGARDIWLWDRTTQQVTTLTNDRAQDIEPSFHPNGQEVLFSSDLDGIYNIYSISLPQRTRRRLTHEYTGAFSPELSPDGKTLLFVRYQHQGFNLFSTSLSQLPRQGYPISHARPTSSPSSHPASHAASLTSRPVPSTQKLLQKAIAAASQPATKPSSFIKTWPKVRYNTGSQIYPIQDYNPLDTLAPLTWLPAFSGDLNGFNIGFRFSGEDVLRWHRYDVTLNLNTNGPDFSYALSYDFERYLIGFHLRHGMYQRLGRFGLYIDGLERVFTERVIYNSLVADVALRTVYDTHLFALRYDVDILLPITVDYDLRPEDIPPVFPRFGPLTTLSFDYVYNNARRFGRSISTEIGRTIRLSAQLQHPYIGSIATSWQTTASWDEYIPLPWLQHVMALHLEGGIGRTNFRARPLFYMGGIPAQDIVQALISGFRAANRYLRGYDAFRFSGDTYGLFKFEYRLPIVEIERGLDTAPFFLRRITAAFFSDTGVVFNDQQVSLTDLKVGVGLEIRAEIFLGYGGLFEVRAGFAKGLIHGGTDQLYFVLGSPF